MGHWVTKSEFADDYACTYVFTSSKGSLEAQDEENCALPLISCVNLAKSDRKETNTYGHASWAGPMCMSSSYLGHLNSLQDEGNEAQVSTQ